MYDLIREWAIDNGININVGQGQQLAKLVEEKFKSTNSSIMPCPEFTDGLEWCHLGFKDINCGGKPCGLARHN